MCSVKASNIEELFVLVPTKILELIPYIDKRTNR